MFVLYEVLLYLVTILIIPWFFVLALTRGKYLRNLAPRLGRYKTTPMSCDLWIHAVSVGEVMVARPVIEEIQRRRPATTILLTTTTLTGQALAEKTLPSIPRTYFPFDFSFSVRRFLNHHRPAVFVTMETEIWPNVIHLASRRGMRLMIANGRISDRSYPRYRFVRRLLRPILAQYDRILVRERVDAERFKAIGAREAVIEVSGNIKFDLAPPIHELELATQLERLMCGRALFVAGSILEGEEPLILPILSDLVREAGVFVVIAPRKPERFEAVASSLRDRGVSFVRRSELAGWRGKAADVLLLDSIGELASVYRDAVAAFVGGSLIPAGGHNPIEPVAVGCPVAFGPSMSNFREIAAILLDAKAAVEIATARQLIPFVQRMTSDLAARAEIVSRGLLSIEKSRGAAGRTAARILELLPDE